MLPLQETIKIIFTSIIDNGIVKCDILSIWCYTAYGGIGFILVANLLEILAKVPKNSQRIPKR